MNVKIKLSECLRPLVLGALFLGEAWPQGKALLGALLVVAGIGLFAWVVLPEYMDAKELQMKCLEKKVAFVPGGSFFPNGGHENTLRLNYSCMPEEKIVQGITALCQTIRENLR